MFQFPLAAEAETQVQALRESLSKATSRELAGHKKKVHSVAWNCTGHRIASGSVDQTAHVWAVDSGKTTVPSQAAWSSPTSNELKGHTNSVDQLTWDPTHPDLLATASTDKSVRFWDIRVNKAVAVVSTSGENINIAWSPDSQHVAVGNKEDQITIIDTKKFKALKNTKFLFEVNEIAWDASGNFFFITTGNGTIEIMRYLERVKQLQSHTANCFCIEFDPTNRYFATGGADALVNLWDAKELICVRTFSRLDYPIRTMSFSHDGSLLASASEDLVIDVAHVETGAPILQIQCAAATNTVAWHPKQNLLAYAGDERDKYEHDKGIVRLWGFPPAST